MPNVQERFQAVSDKLTEATQEILALIEQLRAIGVTPEAEAILVQIETKANGLADIVPNA